MSVRRLSDIDLLAKKKDIDSIGRLLADNGYKRISNIFLDNKKFTIEKALSHFQYKKDSMVVVAHWKFQNIPGVAFNEERVWQKARDIDIGNMHFRTLCVEDALLAHILSFFVDLELKRALYLKALLHIYGILSKCYDKIDWLQFFEERKTDGTYKISLNILFICIDIFQAKDEFPILWNLFKERNEHIAKDLNLDFNITRSIGDYIKNKIASFYMLDVPFSKALFWWGETLPYRILGYR
jgi:hypothetical protein